MQLGGTTCLVTGASSGIGRAVAVTLAERGAHLLLTGHDPGRLGEVGRRTGAATYAADLAEPQQVASLAEWALSQGPPRVVVHNAGVGLLAAAHEGTEEQLQHLVSVNLSAPISLTRRLLPALGGGPGRLVFVTSIAGLIGAPRESVYSASKAALHGYAESLRYELAGGGVGVTTFAPGIVDTGFFARRGATYDRRFPRPMTTDRVATELVAAIEHDRDTVVLPRWLRIPVALHALAPGLYHRLAGRWA